MTAFADLLVPLPVGPDFNKAAANAVYSAIAKCATDEEAALLAGTLLGAMYQHELVVHGREIAKAAAAGHLVETTRIAKGLLETAVAQARAGQDSTASWEAIERLEQVTKAAAYDPSMFTPDAGMRTPFTALDRAQQARKQKRDLLTGQFVTEHKEVLHQDGEKPLAPREAAVLGIPNPGEHRKLTSRQLAHFQRGYHEVSQMLGQYHGLKPDEAAVHLNYATGKSDVIAFPADGRLKIGTRDGAPGLDPTRKLVSASVSVLPATAVDQRFSGAAFGTGGLLNADTLDPGNAGSLGDELTRSTENEEYSPGVRALRRAGALADTIETTLGDKAPGKLRMALKTSQLAGELGPQAQKVIGPAADRTAYRYRGTERKTVDNRLRNAAASVTGPGRRERIVHGSEDDQGNWRPSAVLSYFRTRLPRADLNTLQRKSGTIPPSEGAIVDKNGRIAVQAVGYADDHYLPFNLKNLTKLKGGEYIRTRSFGGPTTEDIYTGLVGGAKSLTVVSHNGTYTMEFDDDLKGGRRLNDKAARMVARYGQLLDAVKSEQVTTGGIHPSRMAELEGQAGRYADRDREPARYEEELDRLKTVERRNPKLSSAQRQEATAEFFANEAANHRTADGHVMTTAEYTADVVNADVARAVSADRAQAVASQRAPLMGEPGAVERYRAGALERYGANESDPVAAGRKLAEATGRTRALDAHLARAELDYKSSLTPLQLNSQGYELALTALQEQFPYYVKRVDFHPWADGGNGFDTGYVKPRHNRPAAALAGYFDKTITGRGKATADSVRFQNHQVRQGRLNLVETATQRSERQGTRPPVAAEVPDDVASSMDADALRAMVGNIRSQVAFSPRATLGQLAGTPIADALSQMQAGEHGAKQLAWLHTEDRGKLDTMATESPERLRSSVQAALNYSDTHGLLDVDGPTRRSFGNRGKYDPPKQLDSARAAKHLDDPADTEYAFGAQAFDEDARRPSSEIADTYRNDHVIAGLRDAGDLPDSIEDGSALEQRSRDLRNSLREDRSALNRWHARRSSGVAAGAEPVAEHELNRRVEGLLRARQLQRRYTEAVRREQDVRPAPGLNNGNVVVVHPDTDPDALRGLLGS